jgi:hypothetical protein
MIRLPRQARDSHSDILKRGLFSGSWSAFPLDGADGSSMNGGGQGQQAMRAPKLSKKDFRLDFSDDGRGRVSHKGDMFDLVISGLGWVSIRAAPAASLDSSMATGEDPASSSSTLATISVSAPLGTLKLLRTPSLMPFEDGGRAAGHRRGRGGQAARVQRKKHFTRKRTWTPAHKRVSKKRAY